MSHDLICFDQEFRGRQAVAYCSPPGCVGSHIQSIWQILEGNETMRRKSRCSPHCWCPTVLLSWPRQFGGVQFGFNQSSGKSLTNHHPDAKLGPGPRGHLHHEINVQKDAHQWEDRQSRHLWAESGHPWTHYRHSKGRPYPMIGGDSSPGSGCAFRAYWDYIWKHWVWIREGLFVLVISLLPWSSK